ncbi:uncharacterized protein KY384_000760 [Bacidia gigantensis]|uniref:uncharacterized protein n=1 Tax=Bacidia gigantensis TaxID=2732470 RepID=UPI001D04FDA2|nr:uncharacterized protein KY384_000760 [Bacidia gigantensis]KAG8525998.1 hypothetical protein KY384_000760 [Bacidia gigantensis]
MEFLELSEELGVVQSLNERAVSKSVSQRSDGFVDLETGENSEGNVTQSTNDTSETQARTPNSSSETNRKAKYSLRQAFFIAAGGLAVETKSFSIDPFLTDVENMRADSYLVTTLAALELARLGLISPIAPQIIDDKAKADPITKLVVCVQAGWFIVQCIARTSQHLPLALLEIHTLAHVALALFMYLAWFAKPYDAISPHVISDSKVVEVVALFSLYSPGTQEILHIPEKTHCVLDCRTETELIDKLKHIVEDEDSEGHAGPDTVLSTKQQRLAQSNHALCAIEYLRHNEMHLTCRPSEEGENLYLASYVSDFLSIPGSRYRELKASSFSRSKPKLSHLHRVLFLYEKGILLPLLILAYSAFHLCAWNAQFPTTIERWMWRGAGLAILATPFAGVLSFCTTLDIEQVLGTDQVTQTKPFWSRYPFTKLCLRILFECIRTPTLWAWSTILLAAVFGRLYFLVEAFVCLRQQTPDLYKTVQWTQFWPHG